MLLVKYSFGYTNNIQYEVSLSQQQVKDELNISKTTSKKIFDELQAEKLIKRVKWQEIGPKQAYKYMVAFPKGFHIKHKANTKSSRDIFDAFSDQTKALFNTKWKSWQSILEAGSDDTWEHFLQNYFNPSEPALTADQLL